MALSHFEQTETSRIFLHSLTISTLQGDGFRLKLVKRGLLSNFFMPERVQKPVEPAPWGPKQGDGGGPRSPDVSRPDTKDLLKKMRKVDPNQSKRYRQRTGE